VKAQLLFYPVTEQLFVFNKEAKLIKETEGRFTCTDCGHVYSSMLGDDEIPNECNQCYVYNKKCFDCGDMTCAERAFFYKDQVYCEDCPPDGYGE